MYQKQQNLWLAIKPAIDFLVSILGAILLTREVTSGMFSKTGDASSIALINIGSFVIIVVVIAVIALAVSRNLNHNHFMKQVVLGLLIINTLAAIYFVYTRLLLEDGILKAGGTISFAVGTILRIAALAGSIDLVIKHFKIRLQ